MYISTQLTEDKKNVIVWERDPDGKRSAVYYDAPYELFVENDDSDQEYYTLTKKKLEKIEFSNPYEFYGARKRLREAGIQLYESDISVELKVLSDHYYNKPLDSELNLTFYDIEVDYDPARGHSDADDPYARISSIALYHKHTDKSVVLALRPKKGKWSKVQLEDLPKDLFEHSSIELCTNEKELLTRFYQEIGDSDIVSGWNCLPRNASVWKSDEIVRIDELAKGDTLFDSTVIQTSPISNKKVYNIRVADGSEIMATKEHRFPVVVSPNGKYTKFSNHSSTLHEEKVVTVEDMENILEENTYSVFMKICTRDNTNSDVEGLVEEDCYLAGLLYADGSLTNIKKTYGYTFYQSDLEFITEISESGTISGNRTKGYSTYIRPRSELFHSLIYDTSFKKKLNLNLLSTLSKKQFYAFLSGLLDGNGWMSSGRISLCCFNSQDLHTIHELLLWNGIFSLKSESTITLVHFNQSELSLKKTSQWANKILNTPLKRNNSQKSEFIKFKKISEFEYLVRLKNIEGGELTETMDIETDSHYFVSGGFRTHNCEFFDRPYVYNRTLKTLGKKYTRLMNYPESNLDVLVDEREKFGTMEMVVKPHGRIWIDFMAIVKKFDSSERDSHSLEAVASEVLEGRFDKLSYDKSLYHLYHEDFDEFLRYNIRDTDILKHLDLKFKYMNLALSFSHIVANNFASVLGTTSTSDTAILNSCKYEKDVRFVVPDAPHDVFDDGKKFEGAFVLDPQTGLHKWISAVDLKSLYPLTMRSLNISPETLIGQFFENEKAFEYIQEGANDIELTLMYEDTDETMSAIQWRTALEDRNWAISGHGTIFDQSKEGIIPSILTKWFDERIEYQRLKAEAYAMYEKTKDPKYKKDAEYYDNIQYLKKIQLNSLYGVFGNRYFRFFDVRIAESTTKSGKNILLHMGKKIAEILDGEYTYPSKSILYGDTDSIFFKSDLDEEDITLDEVSAISDLICDKVNKSYPAYMKKAFNCTDGREYYMSAEKEIVSDQGIFVSKKHYLLHIVELDGKPVDKMKVMGLQIKKTNIPKPIRIKLTSFFERLLKGEDWIVIKRDVVDYKKLLKEGDIFNIGVPSGVNNVEEGTYNYKKDPKCRTYHMVKASILYNDCLEIYEDHESYPIRSGNKVKKFYFYKKKNFGDFNSIAVPVDMNLQPEWLLDNFMPYVDRNRQIQSLVDQPIKNILKAIGEAVPNTRNTLADELIEF